MLLKWARWLPYWVVVRLIRNTYSSDGGGVLKLNEDYNITYYRLGEGEFLVYSNEMYNKMKQKREEKRNEKLDKKLDKVNKIINSDFSLRRQLKEQFEWEKECEENES